MRHRKHTFKIGRSGAHRRALIANMVSSLFYHGKVETTLVKAKEVRRHAEKMITLGKKADLHSRRQAVAKMRDKDAVKILFDEIAPKYADRQGGYTRIIKLGQRRGDAAEMCVLQLVEAEMASKPAKKKAVKEEAPVVEEVAEATVETTKEDPTAE